MANELYYVVEELAITKENKPKKYLERVQQATCSAGRGSLGSRELTGMAGGAPKNESMEEQATFLLSQ